jgi:inosine-uridine nucleoside N-ribohydrolase
MKKILIDTDMGNDDIMAISMLMESVQIQISGISTVNGVSRSTVGALNLNKLLKFCDKDIPIVIGSEQALYEKNAQFPERDILRAEKLTLLNALKMPLKPDESLIKSINTIEDNIYENVTNGTRTIIALGPLTNIAKTLIKYGQKFENSVDELVLMGGGIKKGNVSPLNFAEYNIWLDPEAANIVFKSNLNIYMIGIDATQYVPTSSAFRKKIASSRPNKKSTKIIKEIIINNDNDFNQFYDPLAISLFLNPKISLQEIRCSISVDLNGNTRGRTCVVPKYKKNTRVVLKADKNKFYEYVWDLIQK